MSNLTEWINLELYPAIYENADRVFTEHNFRQSSIGWISNTYLNGTPHSRADKTYIRKNRIKYIVENSEDTKGIDFISYIKNKNGLSTIDAIKFLADSVGLKLPKGDFNETEYKAKAIKKSILEEANSYFKFHLETVENASKLREYLYERGYNPEECNSMELGFAPPQTALRNYLTEKGYNINEIEEAITLNKGIGSTHTLTIPYRAGGDIKGFIVRTITGAEPKYLVSTGLVRDALFNIPNRVTNELIIVEGYLDALISEQRGVSNIVGLGGAGISEEQIKDAIKRGAKSFTICLDTDSSGIKGTIKTIEKLRAQDIDKIYIATLPAEQGQKVDADSFIKERGVEEFKKVIKEAIPFYNYLLDNIANKYKEKETEESLLTSKDRDSFLEEVVTLGSSLSPTQKDIYLSGFIAWEPIQLLGISKEAVDIAIDKLKANNEREAQSKALSKLLLHAQQLQTKGEPIEALNILGEKVNEIINKPKEAEYLDLLQPITLEQLKEEAGVIPEALDSGYILGDEAKSESYNLLFNAGQLTGIAGATGHGKTAFLLNCLFNVAEKYPNKQFIFLTYEESSLKITQYLLNIYLDKSLNNAPRSNRRLIDAYFKTGETKYLQQVEEFKNKVEEFFTTYIQSGRILIKAKDYTVEELVASIKLLTKRTDKIGGVFLDYFQLINSSSERKRERQVELKFICQELNKLAKTTGLPLILGAQFNRDVKTPLDLHATKLGEAGDIERILSTLIGIYNLEYLALLPEMQPTINKKTKEESFTRDYYLINAKTNKATNGHYIEVLKSRDIPIGVKTVLDFNVNTSKIKNREWANTIIIGNSKMSKAQIEKKVNKASNYFS
jgi:DNA primase catalytic core